MTILNFIPESKKFFFINSQKWALCDLTLIIHTWEKWKAPKVVQSFIERTKSDMQKIVVLTTSGEGNYKMDDVDAITGESILANVPIFIDQITSKLNLLLKDKDGYF